MCLRSNFLCVDEVKTEIRDLTSSAAVLVSCESKQ